MKNEDNSRVSYGRSISNPEPEDTQKRARSSHRHGRGMAEKEGYRPIENGEQKEKREEGTSFSGAVNVFPLNKILL